MVGLPTTLVEFQSASGGVSDECKPETTAFRVTENGLHCTRPFLFLKPRLVPPDTRRTLYPHELSDEIKTEFNKGYPCEPTPQIDHFIPKLIICGKSETAHAQDLIRNVLYLSMEQMAEACHVTRKTLYNWRDSDRIVNPRKAGMDRLSMLARAARDWQASGFRTPDEAMIETPIVRGQSLMDVLRAEKVDLELIQFFGARIALAELDSYEVRNPFE